MDRHDDVPIFLGHFLERNVAKNTSVIHEDIDGTECIDSGLDDLFSKLDRIIICDSLTTSSFDLVDDNVGGSGLTFFVVARN